MAEDLDLPPVDPNRDVEEAEPAQDEEEIEDFSRTKIGKIEVEILKLNGILMNRSSSQLLRFVWWSIKFSPKRFRFLYTAPWKSPN